MKLGNTVQFNSLKWVMEELRQLLHEVQRQFEIYADGDDAGDLEKLKEIVDLLRQIRGTLSLIEIHGAALLSEEMEMLAKGLIADEIPNKDNAHEVFMRAALKLPDYLDTLATGYRDAPILLLPLLNDLRASRNANLLSENVLFFPDVSTSTGIYDKAAINLDATGEDVQALSRKLRHGYQLGLLNWFKGVDIESGLERIKTVLIKLQQASKEFSSGRLWWVAASITDALINKGIEGSIALKSLMGQVDRQIKKLIDKGSAEFEQQVPEDLVKNLLYYVARSEPVTDLVTQVKDEYELDRFLPKASELADIESQIVGPNQELLETVAKAIKEDINQAKDMLDIYVHSDKKNLEKLEESLPLLTKIGDTLGMLGLGNAREIIIAEKTKLESIIEKKSQPSEEALMSMAGVLIAIDGDIDLFVQHKEPTMVLSLTGLEAAMEEREPTLILVENQKVIGAVVNEALRDLARVKDAFITFLSQPITKQPLNQIRNVLKSIKGAMFVEPLNLAAPLLENLEKYIEGVVNEDRIPGPNEQNLFADVVTNLECFLEAISESRIDSDLYLQAAKEAIANLNAGDYEEIHMPMPESSVDVEAIQDIESDLQELAQDLDHQGADSTLINDTGMIPKVTVPTSAPAPAPKPSSVAPVAMEAKDYESLLIITEDADEEILDIFIEEALEELSSISELFPIWKQDANNSDAVTTIRRSFHTLKGSGRLVGAALIGEFAWCMENMFNRFIDGTIKANQQMYNVVEEAITVLPQLIEQIRGNKQPVENVFDLMRRADVIASRSIEFNQESEQTDPENIEYTSPGSEEMAILIDSDEESGSEEIVGDGGASGVHEIDLSDLDGLGEEIEISLPEILDEDESEVDNKKNLTDSKIQQSGVSSLDVTRERSKKNIKITVDPVLLGIFSDESETHLKAIKGFIDNAKTKPQKTTQELLRALHTLNGSSKTAKFHIISEVANLLEMYSKNLEQLAIPWSISDLNLMEQCIAYIYNCIDYLKDHTSELTDEEQIISRLKKRIDETQRHINEQTVIIGGEEEPTSIYEEFDPELVDVFMSEGEELVEASARTLQGWLDSGHSESYISELMRQLHTLKGGARMASIGAIGDLSHTLESLFIAISADKVDITTELENLLQASVDRLADMIDQIKQYQVPTDADDLLLMLERARACEPMHFDITKVQSKRSLAPQESEPIITFEEAKSDNVIAFDKANESLEEAQIFEPPAIVSDDEQESAFQGGSLAQQEQIRVRADKLDNLVNFAGEVNIYHGRLNQHVTDLGFNLGELEQTVYRLRDQLREMEIETEAQIAFRYQHEAKDPDYEFDPLEMDRYSHMQQLTRSLTESASDLDSIKDILFNLVRDSETAVQQQARVSTELQDELLQTRMVKFDGLRTRMRRIVRQTARQLSKKVELYIEGAETEIDRSVQDRMLAPLEHMLRNAVFHGIEPPDDRLEMGKPEQGSIRMSIDRDGSYVVLRITDDGQGIDPDRVRNKALNLGLLDESEEQNDQEVLRYIMHKGFSTAEDVSQIAGRGVGLDVVDIEVKQLGGSLSINSVVGQGTLFTIRLPLTLAINQALLVQTGEDIYAIPLTAIEGVSRITAQQFEDNITGRMTKYEYAGQTYRMYYLGSLLGSGTPLSLNQDQLYPLLLVRSGEEHIGLSIDAMLGRREVVVKPVGPQISSNPGFSGATILADGRVALILDLGGLIRKDNIDIYTASNVVDFQTSRDSDELTVMVVDDSITIRKVTARILGRHRLKVMTAKDGLDAVSQLQSQIPDLFLMDIEMPRMDGFELASHVRAEPRLQGIPIIMITSRTGQKHRDRAEQIGVDRYLGKPFQENELMDEINELLNRKVSA